MGTSRSETLNLLDIKENINQRLTPNLTFTRIGSRIYTRRELNEIAVEIDKLLANGQRDLAQPWPVPDQPLSRSGWVWDEFSDERLLDRTRAVYAGALEGYEQLVRQWFPNFSDRLDTMIILPAKLVGVLFMPKHQGGFQDGPSISWRLEPFQSGSKSTVDICLEGEREGWYDLEQCWERIKTLRPKSSEWVGVAAVDIGALHVFDTRPATDLAYDWLVNDLRRLAWA